MNDFSTTASVLAVIELFVKVVFLCYKYSIAVKKVKKDIQSLQKKIEKRKFCLNVVKNLFFLEFDCIAWFDALFERVNFLWINAILFVAKKLLFDSCICHFWPIVEAHDSSSTKKDLNRWFLIFDNLDRNYQTKIEDQQAYDIEFFWSTVDHDSILITTRLLHFEKHESTTKVMNVNRKQRRQILQNSIRRYLFTRNNRVFRISCSWLDWLNDKQKWTIWWLNWKNFR